jgi:hypothetical protein
MKSVDSTIRILCNTVLHQWRRGRNHLLLPATAGLLLAQGACADLAAQHPAPSVYQVEAAYLYNFGKFVKWPAAHSANQGGDFSICVLGDDRFDVVLQSTLSGTHLAGIPVVVRQIAKPQDAASCRVLFIDSDEEGHLQGILAVLDRESVLTVSDIPDFSRRGGMIEFVMQDGRVRFAINRTTAENAGLVLESNLLEVAAAVRGTDRSGGPK